MTTTDPTTATAARSQSSVLGVTLLFAIVVAGTGILLLVGGTALTQTQTQSNVERATQEMTLFDSRAAMVALGNAETQSSKLSGGQGSYTVDNESGYIVVLNDNYDGGNDTANDTEVILNSTLGALTYSNGETTITYQGGGVWRRDGNGGGTMVSPPEFHYRRATLTLPVIRVNNTDSASGSIRAIVQKIGTTQRVFPNTNMTHTGTSEVGPPYDEVNGTRRAYENPIRNGTVSVKVHSKYHEGWFQYFEQRTSGDADDFDENNTATVTLRTISGSIGAFSMPNEGNSLNIRGMNTSGHPINEYEVTLAEGSNWKNVHWSLYVDEPNEKAEFHIHVPGGTKCNDGSPDTLSNDIDISVFYQNTSGSTDIHEEWQNQNVGPSGYDVNCDTKELTVQFVPSNTQLTYKNIDGVPGSSGNKWIHSGPISSSDPTSTARSFDQSVSGHAEDSSLGTYTFGDGDTEDMGAVVNHYMGLLAPNHDLTVTDGPGSGKGRIDEGDSSGVLSFETATGTQYLTFLHVTKNRIRIELE